MTYIEIIRNTYQDRACWNYYSDQGLPERIDSSPECIEFIKSFFSKSGKAGCLYDLVPDLKEIPNERWMHIVYTFFLGIFFYEKNEIIRKCIDKQLDRMSWRIRPVSNVKFQFVWFLICLFHDLGYVFESKNQYSCKLDDYRYKVGRLSGVPSFFSKNLYDSYERFIHPNDHGICGGVKMFNVLCEVRNNQESIQAQNEFLSWDRTLIPYYRLAASAVICHNIWFVNEDEKSCLRYKAIGLHDLVKRAGEYKIDQKKYPLFFLLCLVDDIEPIKKVKDIALLRDLSITLLDDMITITINEKSPKLKEYLNQISVGSWLAPICSEENMISIKIV